MDNGCKYHSDCFTCPFSMCKFEKAELKKSKVKKQVSTKNSGVIEVAVEKTNKKYKGTPKERQQQRYQEHREEILAYQKRYRELNRDRLIQKRRQKVNDNLEEHRATNRKNARLKQYYCGKAKPVGIMSKENKEVTLYRGNKGTYWYVLDGEYFEVTRNEILQTRSFVTARAIVGVLEKYLQNCDGPDKIYFEKAIRIIENKENSNGK